MYERILESAGLNAKEVLVYQALLKLGETSIKPLLRETSLKRSTLYDILYSLERKQLCDLTVDSKRTRFRPTSPKNLLTIAEEQRDQSYRAVNNLTDVLPKLLEQFQLQGGKPFIAYYTGIEGIKKAYAQILEKRQPLKILASYLDRNNQTLRGLVEQQTKKQRLLGITYQAIVPSDAYTTDSEKQKRLRQQAVEIRTLNNFHLASQIIVFGNNVAISSMDKEIFTTYMENQAISQSLSTIFDQLWVTAKPPATQ